MSFDVFCFHSRCLLQVSGVRRMVRLGDHCSGSEPMPDLPDRCGAMGLYKGRSNVIAAVAVSMVLLVAWDLNANVSRPLSNSDGADVRGDRGAWHLPSNTDVTIDVGKIDGMLELQAHIKSMSQTNPQSTLARIYTTYVTESQSVIPPGLATYIRSRQLDLSEFEAQKVCHVINRVTREASHFNPVRAKRPGASNAALSPQAWKKIWEAKGSADPFNHDKVKQETASETWGRCSGKFTLTAANMARYAGQHGLVIPRQFAIHEIDLDVLTDMLSTAVCWFSTSLAHHFSNDGVAFWPNIMWDITEKGGASQPHNHMQVSLTPGSYGSGWDQRLRAAKLYFDEHKTDYFADLLQANSELGLAIRPTNHPHAVVLVSMTPASGYELEIYAEPQSLLMDFAFTVHQVLKFVIEEEQWTPMSASIMLPPATAFNSSASMKALPQDLEGGNCDLTDGAEYKCDMPIIMRLVYRGSATAETSDVSSNELLGTPIPGRDPTHVAKRLKSFMSR